MHPACPAKVREPPHYSFLHLGAGTGLGSRNMMRNKTHSGSPLGVPSIEGDVRRHSSAQAGEQHPKILQGEKYKFCKIGSFESTTSAVALVLIHYSKRPHKVAGWCEFLPQLPFGEQYYVPGSVYIDPPHGLSITNHSLPKVRTNGVGTLEPSESPNHRPSHCDAAYCSGVRASLNNTSLSLCEVSRWRTKCYL